MIATLFTPDGNPHRRGDLLWHPAQPPSTLVLPHVWTRPPFLRCQRDQDRVRHSAGAADTEFSAKLEPAPTDSLPVVRYDLKAGQRSLDMLRWGLIPYWAKDMKVGFSNINAKAEGIENKPAFRKALERRRCLVPVDNFL